MSSILDKLAHGNHLSRAEVERVGASARAFLKEAQRNPRLSRDYVEKVSANFSDVLKQMGMAAGISAGAVGAATLANLGVKKILDVANDFKKAKRYKVMMDANPELKAQGINSKMVQMHFNTLHKFNPDYADDPLVAGAYVQNQIEATRPNIEALNNIVKARRERVQSVQPFDAMGSVIGPQSAAMGQLQEYMRGPGEQKVTPPDPLEGMRQLREIGELERSLGAQRVPEPPDPRTGQPLYTTEQLGALAANARVRAMSGSSL